jgi:hypothetical protein
MGIAAGRAGWDGPLRSQRWCRTCRRGRRRSPRAACSDAASGSAGPARLRASRIFVLASGGSFYKLLRAGCGHGWLLRRVAMDGCYGAPRGMHPGAAVIRLALSAPWRANNCSMFLCCCLLRYCPLRAREPSGGHADCCKARPSTRSTVPMSRAGGQQRCEGAARSRRRSSLPSLSRSRKKGRCRVAALRNRCCARSC